MSETYGLTATGFNIKRLQEIKAEIENDLREYFGDDIDLAADSVFGQLVGAFSMPTAEEWEMLQAVYTSLFPASAEGLQLDHVASLNGLSRLAATKTTIEAAMFSENCPVTVPADTLASVANTDDVFKLDADTVIDGDETGATAAIVEVAEVTATTAYSITIDGTAHTFTTGSPAETAIEIAQELTDKINAGALALTHGAYAPGDGTVEIFVRNHETPFTLAVTATKLEMTAFGVFGVWACSETGRTSCPVYGLTVIETPVANFDLLRNYEDGVLGRDTETDTEFRARRLNSFQVSGAATVEAIRSRLLQDVSGMTDCSVFENPTDVTEDSIPPHAIWCVCEIPDTPAYDQAVAEEIWAVKAGGIATHGDVAVDVVDSQGFTHEIKFSRPTVKYAWVYVGVSAFNTEETLPVDWEEQIKDNIVALGGSFLMGNDMILQKFYAPVMSIPGISTISLKIAAETLGSDPPSWSLVNLPIGKTTRALFSTDRVLVYSL